MNWKLKTVILQRFAYKLVHLAQDREQLWVLDRLSDYQLFKMDSAPGSWSRHFLSVTLTIFGSSEAFRTGGTRTELG
jgi:hypothetical protein